MCQWFSDCSLGEWEQDTVIDAGRYDGALGIVTAIAAVKVLKVEGWLQQFPRPIEVGSVFMASDESRVQRPWWPFFLEICSDLW